MTSLTDTTINERRIVGVVDEKEMLREIAQKVAREVGVDLAARNVSCKTEVLVHGVGGINPHSYSVRVTITETL